MTDRNKEFRDQARAVLSGALRFSDFKQFGLWDKSVNAPQLPAFAVGVPRWGVDLSKGLDTRERVVTLVVVVKRCTGNLEDLADEDCAEIERLLLAAFDDSQHELDLQESNFQEDAGGEKPVGTLSMMFAIKYWPATT